MADGEGAPNLTAQAEARVQGLKRSATMMEGRGRFPRALEAIEGRSGRTHRGRRKELRISDLSCDTGVEASAGRGRAAHRAAITKARVPAQRKTKIDERIARNAPGKLQQRHEARLARGPVVVRPSVRKGASLLAYLCYLRASAFWPSLECLPPVVVVSG